MKNAAPDPNAKSDDVLPDTPPEVLARQGKARGLTAETVQLLGADRTTHMHEDGSIGQRMDREASAEARRAAARAEQLFGSEPLKGLAEEQINAVKNMEYPREDYPTVPKMGQMGDRDPQWLNWLWATSPKAAAIRYAYRSNCWPTKLPKAWPPAKDPFEMPVVSVKTVLAAATPGQGFTLEQVNEMVASASKSAAEAAVAGVLAAQKAQQGAPALSVSIGDANAPSPKPDVVATLKTTAPRKPRPTTPNSAPSTPTA